MDGNAYYFDVRACSSFLLQIRSMRCSLINPASCCMYTYFTGLVLSTIYKCKGGVSETVNLIYIVTLFKVAHNIM